MVVATAKRGRYHPVAIMDFVDDEQLELRDRFYKACSSFHYREIMAVSHALGVWPSTVDNWKYKITFPGEYIARKVIKWVDEGKPIRMEPPWQSIVDML